MERGSFGTNSKMIQADIILDSLKKLVRDRHVFLSIALYERI